MGVLFVCNQEAMKCAAKLRMLVQYLRALRRRSRKSRCKRIQALKNLVKYVRRKNKTKKRKTGGSSNKDCADFVNGTSMCIYEVCMYVCDVRCCVYVYICICMHARMYACVKYI